MIRQKETNLSSEVFFGVRKKILLSFYIIFVTSLSILFLVIISNIPHISGISKKIQLLFIIFFPVVAVIVGAYFSVILDLPKISYEFDKIKNEIALKKIKCPNVFAHRIVTLLCNYFTFHFFTSKYAFFKIINNDYVYSDNILQNSINEKNFESMLNKSQQTEGVSYISIHYINEKKHYLYIIPIWFGDEWLGYVGILTEKKLMKTFCSFLAHVENIYIDDMLIHVLEISKNYSPFGVRNFNK